MPASISLSASSLLVVLNLAYSANAQIGYRRRTASPARIIAGAVVGGIALLFFICAFVLFSRRRRARRFQLVSIPRPHVGEQPYAGPQQYGPPGSGPYMQQNQAPWQPSYNSGRTPYSSQQPPVGVKAQEEQLPPYTREKDFATQDNTSVQPPPPIHSYGQNVGNETFVGGFRHSHGPQV